MKVKTLPVISMRFVEKLSKTAIELDDNGSVITVFANGDMTQNGGLLCNIVVNEVGDKFTATKDSSTLDDKGKPIYKKGETVTRQTQSCEYKSLTGNGQAAQFAQAAGAFKLTLNVVMGA